MATIRGFTAERMLEIESSSVVTGEVDPAGNLRLHTRGGDEVLAGHVKGSKGDTGLPGADGADGINGVDRVIAHAIGEIFFWSGPLNTTPAGTLLANGSHQGRAEYSDLFAIYGTLYGAGDGSTTFTLPNFSGRVPVGYDTTQTEFDTVGEVGGTKTHTLTTAQIPAHTHIQNAHNHVQDAHNHTQNQHQHGQNVSANEGGTALRNDYSSDQRGGVYSQGVATDASIATNNPATATNQAATATNQNAGGGSAHNNLQPYLVGLWLIKAKYASSEINPNTTTHVHNLADIHGLAPVISVVEHLTPGSWITSLALNTGYTSTAGYAPPAYRLLEDGTILELRSTRLSVANIAMGASADYSIILAGGLPSAIRPPAHGIAHAYSTSNAPMGSRLTLTPEGALTIRLAVSQTTYVIDIPMQRFYLRA